MMRKLYDLARGTVKLRVSGPQPERILNFCAEHGIESLQGFFDDVFHFFVRLPGHHVPKRKKRA